MKYLLIILLLILCQSPCFAQKMTACENKITENIVHTDNMTGICDEFNLSKKEKTQLQKKLQKQARAKIAEIKDQFKDPDSVKLKNLRISESGLVICGDANAKNGYGGYGGHKSFYYTWMISALRIEGEFSFSANRYSMDCHSDKVIIIKN